VVRGGGGGEVISATARSCKRHFSASAKSRHSAPSGGTILALSEFSQVKLFFLSLVEVAVVVVVVSASDEDDVIVVGPWTVAAATRNSAASGATRS
jgi:hypothetical protein